MMYLELEDFQMKEKFLPIGSVVILKNAKHEEIADRKKRQG